MVVGLFVMADYIKSMEFAILAALDSAGRLVIHASELNNLALYH